MRLQDIMSTGVRVIAPNDEIVRAQTEMEIHKIHHLVVTEGTKVVGMLSAHDLVEREGRTVGEVMTPDPIVVPAKATVREAANSMRGNGVGALPVVNERGRLVGIVTLSDLLELIGRGVEKPIEAHVPWTLRRRAPKFKRPRRGVS
jgi:CBS domain-containing protein